MNLFKHLKKLTDVPGPSGQEGEIAGIIAGIWQPLTDELSTDHMGNLMALKYGEGDEPRPKIMIMAHMDAIGLMAAGFAERNGNGFLHITKLGGVDLRQLLGQSVLVQGRNAGEHDLIGVVAALPPSYLPADRRSKTFKWDDLVVDTGLSIAELKEKVAVGDFVTFRQTLRKLQGSRVAGKALDNRACVAAVTSALAYLQKCRHSWDVVVVASVQEETRLLGAHTVSFTLQPDQALVVDVTQAVGPGTPASALTFKMGDGPVLGIGPILNDEILAGLQKTAKELEMKVHLEPHTSSTGTDATAIQAAGAGIPTGLIGIPLRNMHATVEIVDTTDVKRTGRLIGGYIANLEIEGELEIEVEDRE